MKFLRNNATISALLASVVLGLAATTAPAQTLYGLDSLGGAGLPMVREFTGPPTGPCAYPNGPLAGYPSFTAGPVGCPGPLPFAGWPANTGDITINRYTDTLWVAGANEIGEYTTLGAQIAGFAVPFTVTGLGMDSAAGRLWVSSPGIYRRVTTGCGLFGVDMGPFANPMGGLLTDIDYDAATGLLWACNDLGMIASFMPGAAGPLCTFDVTPLGLGPVLSGLALDATTPGLTASGKVLFVTDGVTIARINVPASCASGIGVLAGTTFAHPVNPFPVAGGPISGLAYAAHGAVFGSSSGCDIGMTGQSVLGTTPSINLANADAGDAVLLIDLVAQCPALTFAAVPLYVLPLITTPPIAHAGSFALAAGIPAGIPVGARIFVQWVNHKTAGGWEGSPGMVFTTSLP